jgi:hypothetical protein
MNEIHSEVFELVYVDIAGDMAKLVREFLQLFIGNLLKSDRCAQEVLVRLTEN